MDPTARLIELVREKEIIYDPFHPNKKNRQILNATWADIASGCGMSVEQAKTRWSSIRTTYGKKKKEAMHRPSGSAAIVKEGWAYFSMCKFLDRYIKHRKTLDNIQVGGSDVFQESMNDPSSDDQASVETMEKDYEIPSIASGNMEMNGEFDVGGNEDNDPSHSGKSTDGSLSFSNRGGIFCTVR